MPDALADAGGLTEIAGIATEIVSRGSGRPLLFLHPEIGFDPDAPIVDRLAQKFAFVGPSHPGFGHTALPGWMTSVDDLSYFHLDVLEALDLRDAVVVGVGFGGWIAAEMAVKCQDRISHLVLVNPAGIKTGGPEDRDMQDIFSMSEDALMAAAFHDPAVGGFDPKAASEDEIYVKLRNRESVTLFAWSPYMYSPKLRHRLRRIRVPTMVLWGTSDDIAPESYGRAFCGDIDGARFETMERAGRFAHIEQPEEFASRIEAFVDE